MYSLLCICLMLSALLAINALSSFVPLFLWRVAKGASSTWSAASRADFLFTLRLLPILLSLFGVVFFLLPSYLAYEPRTTSEVVSFKLELLAALSLTGITLAIWRGFSSFRATKQLTAEWLRHAELMQLENISIPTYRIRHQFPVVAVVGVLQPKLFIASSLLATLDQEELTAVLAHETGHLKQRDNFKRGLLRACRDVLMFIPSGRVLDREWLEMSEAAADEYAARRAPSTALDLASALIKIARIVPEGGKPTMPAGAFLIGDETENGDTLTLRVQRLAQRAESNFIVEKDGRERFSGGFLWICFGLLFFAMILAATNSDVLAATHTGIERIVAFLS